MPSQTQTTSKYGAPFLSSRIVVWQSIYDKYFKDFDFDTSSITSKAITNNQDKLLYFLKAKYASIKRQKGGAKFIEKVLRENRGKHYNTYNRKKTTPYQVQGNYFRYLSTNT